MFGVVTATEIVALRGTERLKRGCVLASRTNSGVHGRWRERFSNGKPVKQFDTEMFAHIVEARSAGS